MMCATPGISDSSRENPNTASDIPSSDVEIDGVAELWYDDRESMMRALATPEAKALYADGALFIGRIKSYTTEEKEIIPLRR